MRFQPSSPGLKSRGTAATPMWNKDEEAQEGRSHPDSALCSHCPGAWVTHPVGKPFPPAPPNLPEPGLPTGSISPALPALRSPALGQPGDPVSFRPPQARWTLGPSSGLHRHPYQRAALSPRPFNCDARESGAFQVPALLPSGSSWEEPLRGAQEADRRQEVKTEDAPARPVSRPSVSLSLFRRGTSVTPPPLLSASATPALPPPPSLPSNVSSTLTLGQQSYPPASSLLG